MITCVKLASAALIVSLFAIACSATQTEGDAEKTGKTDEALAEAACGTNPLTAVVPGFGTTTASAGAIVQNPNYQCFWTDVVSSGSSYGSSGCESQFIVEVGAPSPAPKVTAGHFEVYPAVAIDQATCAKAQETLGAYGHDAGGWHLIGFYSGHGQWAAADGIIAAHCDFATDLNTIPASFAGNTYDKVRAAASLYTLETLKGSSYNAYLPVTTGIHGGAGC